MSQRILNVSKLSAGYGDFRALFEIDFEVAKDEVVALIGANGNGKSTLLCSIVNLLAARAGQVDFAGEDITRTPTHELTRKGLTMVPEGRRLSKGMTVEDNLRVARDRARRIGPDETGWTLEWIYGLFPILAERRRQLVEKLSGGQQQMVAIDRAMVTHPELLLCDEISLGLAPKVVGEIYAMIPVIRDAGTAVS